MTTVYIDTQLVRPTTEVNGVIRLTASEENIPMLV